jgi:hypothetical protein
MLFGRCLDPDATGYKDYGGRGITICERWFDLRNFLTDMGPLPEGRTLDRIDVNGGYEPENCRWATSAEQGRNRRNNVWLTLDGERLTLSEAARKSGVDSSVAWRRHRDGMPIGQSTYLEGLTPAQQVQIISRVARGESISDVARAYGVGKAAIHRCLAAMTDEEYAQRVSSIRAALPVIQLGDR